MIRPILFVIALAATAFAAAADGVVNVYSYREPALVEPLFRAFTRNTGIDIKMVFADKGLVERMEQEGELSPVDVLLTSDVTRLVDAAAKGLGQPVISEAITAHVPPYLRDPENQWFGLTMRARVVYASRDRVSQDAISYEELADPKWKGKICMRAADHPYNLALVAGMIAERGEAETKAWLEGLKANLIAKPNGNDRAQAKSIFAGECDLGIGNTYYVGLMATNEKEPEQKDWAKAIKVLIPHSEKMGSHVNISGMLLARHAPNKANAIAFMEFLASDKAQKTYADSNFEYPVNPAVPPNDLVASLGTLNPSIRPIGDLAKFQATAIRLIEETGINQ